MTTPPAETPMVEIPAGEFMMGADGTQALEDERPSHRVWLDAFSIDLHEVTTAQYAAFLSADKRAGSMAVGNRRSRPARGSSRDRRGLARRRGVLHMEGQAASHGSRVGKSGAREQTHGCIPGAIKRRPEIWRILRWVRASATTRSCFPCVRTRQARVPMGFITWPATPTNGCKTGTEPTTTTLSPDRNPPGPEPGPV